MCFIRDRCDFSLDVSMLREVLRSSWNVSGHFLEPFEVKPKTLFSFLFRGGGDGAERSPLLGPNRPASPWYTIIWRYGKIRCQIVSFSSYLLLHFQLLHSLDEILLLNIDVSFAATSFALADLARYKDVQDRVRQEIDKILQGCDPSSFPDLEKKLPYMESVLKESARMNPALALSLPERTVKHMTDLGGYQIPKGVSNIRCPLIQPVH